MGSNKRRNDDYICIYKLIQTKSKLAKLTPGNHSSEEDSPTIAFEKNTKKVHY